MEVKRGSPSQGLLRANVDPAAQARAYRGAADANSVLTDGPYFGGSFADLRTVREAFDGPLLPKAFIVDPRQVADARVDGRESSLVVLVGLSLAETARVVGVAQLPGVDCGVCGNEA